MIRSLRIEYYKLKSAKYFQIMVTLWTVAFLLVPFGLKYFLDEYFTDEIPTNELIPISPSSFPIFDFADICQNMAYIYKIITVLPLLIMIINVGMEWEEKTIRQNIIDGMSRMDFVSSKWMLILAMATLSTALLVVVTLSLGFIYSPVVDLNNILETAVFIPAYFLHVVTMLSIGFLLINLIRKTGLTIIITLVLLYFIEPAMNILNFLSGTEITMFLPFESSWQLIPSGFGKYVLGPVRSSPPGYAWFIATGWLIIVQVLNWKIITGKDLK